MKAQVLLSGIVLIMVIVLPECVSAHDPVFGLGPHTLYKGGVELHAGGHNEKSGNASEKEAELQFKYGLTGDWVIGVGVPYEFGDDEGSHRGSTSLSTKYRFWRQDGFAVQESMALMGKVIFGDVENHGDVERDGNDYLLGIAYGYEGRKWYRWVSVRHRFNAPTTTGLTRPDARLVDIVGGIRFSPTEYYEPDWVWMLELNGELIENISRGVGSAERRVGGNQWFLSPGLMWTYRNFALKAGVQLPVIDDLSADQVQDDYRAKVELEWHL